MRYAELRTLLGQAAAEALCREFGGQSVYIPRPDHLNARDARIRAMYGAGVNIRDIAEAYGLSPRRVYQVLFPPKN